MRRLRSTYQNFIVAFILTVFFFILSPSQGAIYTRIDEYLWLINGFLSVYFYLYFSFWNTRRRKSTKEWKTIRMGYLRLADSMYTYLAMYTMTLGLDWKMPSWNVRLRNDSPQFRRYSSNVCVCLFRKFYSKDCNYLLHSEIFSVVRSHVVKVSIILWSLRFAIFLIRLSCPPL